MELNELTVAIITAFVMLSGFALFRRDEKQQDRIAAQDKEIAALEKENATLKAANTKDRK